MLHRCFDDFNAVRYHQSRILLLLALAFIVGLNGTREIFVVGLIGAGILLWGLGSAPDQDDPEDDHVQVPAADTIRLGTIAGTIALIGILLGYLI